MLMLERLRQFVTLIPGLAEPARLQNKDMAVIESMNLTQQYHRSIEVLLRFGLLIVLPESRTLGIIGEDGLEYPVPTLEEITEAVAAQPELYAKKMKAGFTELLLVPLGVPLSVLLEKLIQQFGNHRYNVPIKEWKFSDRDTPIKIGINMQFFMDNEQNLVQEILYPGTNAEVGNTSNPNKRKLLTKGVAWQVGLTLAEPRVLSVLSKNSGLEKIPLSHDFLLRDIQNYVQSNAFEHELMFSLEAWITRVLYRLQSSTKYPFDNSNYTQTILAGSEIVSRSISNATIPVAVNRSSYFGLSQVQVSFTIEAESFLNDPAHAVVIPTLLPVALV